MADALGFYSTSYELDIAQRLDISEMITQLSPFDAPFLGTYNGLENAPVPSALPRGTVFQRRYDWLEDELLLPRTTLSALHTAADNELDLTDPAGFQVDDLVRAIDGSGNVIQFRITAIDYDTAVATVVVWSGTDANVASGALVEGIGTLPVEGADPTESRATDRARKYNFTQIFGPYPIEMSETEQVVAKYGVGSAEWAWQVAKRTKESVVAMEQAILYGTRKDDTANKRRSMGGLDFYITAANGSTVDTSTASLAGTAGEDALLAMQQSLYAAGGEPRMVVTGPDNKPDISAWRNTDIRLQLSENRRGQIVTTFESDFGIIQVLMHRWVRPSDTFVFNPEQAEICTLTGRDLQWVRTAKTGDRDQAYMITEKGFKFRASQHAGKFTGL